MAFDAEKELAEIKAKRKLIKRKRYTSSRLDKFSHEIHALKKAGASLSEIRIFLKSKRVNVVNSTIHRWLQKHG